MVLQDRTPRMRGKGIATPVQAVSAGSPPRMRGKGVHGVLQELCCGITPAYAGKSLFSGLYIRINGDHPRVCGEKLLDRYWIGTGLSDTKDHPRVCGEKRSSLAHGRYRMGSPPRMRGKVLSGLATWLPIGITPAYAGKRRKRPEHAVKPWDHPRVCGEKAFPASTRS